MYIQYTVYNPDDRSNLLVVARIQLKQRLDKHPFVLYEQVVSILHVSVITVYLIVVTVYNQSIHPISIQLVQFLLVVTFSLAVLAE